MNSSSTRLSRKRIRDYFKSTSVYKAMKIRFGKTEHGVPLRSLPLIFVIGFNKAGTRSITHLFRSELIPSVHSDKGALAQKMRENVEAGKKIFNGYDKHYLAYSDLTLLDENTLIEGNELFREIYSDYPDSFLILNTRPTQNWVESKARHNKELFMRRYMKHLGLSRD